MGSSTSHHHNAHPPPKQTLKRTISSIFICGSSSKTPLIQMEDESSEDLHDYDNTTKLQRRRKDFDCSSCSTSTSYNDNKPFSDQNSSNERVDMSLKDEHTDITEGITQLNEREINDTSEETAPPVLGFLETDRVQEHRNEVVRRDDLVGSRELRRDGRRLFWDAFSRRNSRRNSESQARDADSSRSRERLFLHFGDESLDRGARRHSRSEIWERIRGGLDGIDRQIDRCPLGLHTNGACSCESDTRPHASISRIVMLAEALFEVLDEIQRQPMSLSLPMVSLPAPESVVDSLPIKIYFNKHNINNDHEQCHICLGEYEEEDEIRVLPCQHEFHTSCVDKWLKETHRVCPLCRGDVCGVASSEIHLA